jgi:hypothetical protein
MGHIALDVAQPLAGQAEHILPLAHNLDGMMSGQGARPVQHTKAPWSERVDAEEGRARPVQKYVLVVYPVEFREGYGADEDDGFDSDTLGIAEQTRHGCVQVWRAPILP